MIKTIHAASGHTLHVSTTPRSELPAHLGKETAEYDMFYTVRNWDENGAVFMYLGKGHVLARKQIVGWYPNTGSMWASYGNSLLEVINGMQRDGWLHA